MSLPLNSLTGIAMFRRVVDHQAHELLVSLLDFINKGNFVFIHIYGDKSVDSRLLNAGNCVCIILIVPINYSNYAVCYI